MTCLLVKDGLKSDIESHGLHKKFKNMPPPDLCGREANDIVLQSGFIIKEKPTGHDEHLCEPTLVPLVAAVLESVLGHCCKADIHERQERLLVQC